MDLLRELLETIGDEMKPMVNDLFEICVDGLSDMSTGVQRAAVKLTVSAITVRLPHRCDVLRNCHTCLFLCSKYHVAVPLVSNFQYKSPDACDLLTLFSEPSFRISCPHPCVHFPWSCIELLLAAAFPRARRPQ